MPQMWQILDATGPRIRDTAGAVCVVYPVPDISTCVQSNYAGRVFRMWIRRRYHQRVAMKSAVYENSTGAQLIVEDPVRVPPEVYLEGEDEPYEFQGFIDD